MFLLQYGAGVCNAALRIAWPLSWLPLQTHCRRMEGVSGPHFIDKYMSNASTVRLMQMPLLSPCKNSHLFEGLE